MSFDFLFWLFFIGIVVASLQDLKRREVDDWLVLFLSVTSFSFILFKALLERNSELVFQLGFAAIILFILMNVFYYGRVFAGGDAKLLFSMTAFFIGATFIDTLGNIGLFVLFLMFAGSIYGLLYSVFLYSTSSKKVNKKIKKEIGRKEIRYSLLIGIFFIVLGVFNAFFLGLGALLILLVLLYIFAKALEGVVMVKTVTGTKLREGDWLEKDVKIGSKIIKANWDGLTLKDIALMKNLRRVKIKEGIPFVPAFLIAYLFYVFFRIDFLRFLAGLA